MDEREKEVCASSCLYYFSCIDMSVLALCFPTP